MLVKKRIGLVGCEKVFCLGERPKENVYAESLKCPRLALFDEARQQMISFAELKRYRPQLPT